MREERKMSARKAVEKDAATPEEKPSKKETQWVLASLLQEVREWPSDVREAMGGQLNKVEYGGALANRSS